MNMDPRRAIPYGPLYTQAINEAIENGESLYDIDMRFLAEYGWTEECEERWREAMHQCGVKLEDMYPPKHGPKRVQDPAMRGYVETDDEDAF